MRTVLALLLFATAAQASPLALPIVPDHSPLPIELATIPRPCAALVKQASVLRQEIAMAARISLAQCIATERLRTQAELVDTQDSIALLEDSVAPSVALLDAAIATAEPKLVILAQHAKGELYAVMTARMLATIPAPAPDASDAALQLRALRGELLTTWLLPWRDAAHDAFAAVVALDKLHPELARDPVIHQAIRDSAQRLEREPSNVASS